MPDTNQFDYDVALSFAGEDRRFVEPIATLLQRARVSVFYDAFEPGALWGKDLYQHFSRVYFERARFFVPFLSAAYAEKKWTAHELQNAQARAFQQTRKEYILPIRLDETEVPGILPTVGYLQYSDYTPERIVDLLLEKLDRSDRSPGTIDRPELEVPVFSGTIPRLRKTFTQREKDLFAQQSFGLIMQYFQEGLKALEASDPDVATDFQAVHRFKFVCTVYVKGDVGNRCKVWLGGGSWSRGSNQINFYTGNEIDMNEDNSVNASLSVSDDGHQLVLEAGYFMYRRGSKDGSGGSAKQAAEDFWETFLEPLQRER